MLRIVAFLPWLGTAGAALYSPRVVSPHNADTYSLRTFANYARWRDLEGDAKVYEVFKYLTDPRTGIYPMGVPAREGRETMSEYSSVTDPVKMLNVYPLGHCGTLGPAAAAILEGIEVGQGRTLILPGWHHVAAEVYYGGRWHYVDLDVRAVFRRADGSLASMSNAQREDELWNGGSNPLFFPLDSLEEVRKAYSSTAVHHRYGVASGGHTMDFVLRQGERFTRWWKPRDGRWNHHASYGERPFPRSVLEQEPRGLKSKHASFTTHTQGNGRIVYKPDLTAASSDFRDGVYDSANVRPGSDGLVLQSPGEGFAVFEVRSPYVIVPLVGDLDDIGDDREASVVRWDATGARLSYSLDDGLTWSRVESGEGIVDLTPHVSGRYGYLLRVELAGEPATAMVRSLEITTWVQVHPASLPSLREGKNSMQLLTGDHYGLQTRAVVIEPDMADREAFAKHVLVLPDDYDPGRSTSRVRGSFVVQASAPPGAKIAWFSAGAAFETYQGGNASETRNFIAYAVNAPGGFREIYRADVPEDQSHWHYNVEREVRLEHPAERLFVRYTGEPGVNQVRVRLHCQDDVLRSPGPVVVAHRWTEGGEPRSVEVKFEGAGSYEIVAGPNPVNESIEMWVPSGFE